MNLLHKKAEEKYKTNPRKFNKRTLAKLLDIEDLSLVGTKYTTKEISGLISRVSQWEG
jgi:hypothetical protein